MGVQFGAGGRNQCTAPASRRNYAHSIRCPSSACSFSTSDNGSQICEDLISIITENEYYSSTSKTRNLGLGYDWSGFRSEPNAMVLFSV